MEKRTKQCLGSCAVIAFFGLIVTVVIVVFGLTKVKSLYGNYKERMLVSQEQETKNRLYRREFLEANLSTEVREIIPDSFYTDNGFRDWWRMPLVFPYQFKFIDTFDSAYLEMHKLPQPVAALVKSPKGYNFRIARAQLDSSMLVFEKLEKGVPSYHLLVFESGEILDFKNEPSLWQVAERRGFTGVKSMVTVEQLYNAYSRFTKPFGL